MFKNLQLEGNNRLKRQFYIFRVLSTYCKMHALTLLSWWVKKKVSARLNTACYLYPRKTFDSHFLTQKACQFVGFLLFNGFIVQRFKVDIQNQNVITANRKGRKEVWRQAFRRCLQHVIHACLRTCFSRQRRRPTPPLSAETKADVSCWEDDLPQPTNFPSVGLVIVVHRGNDGSFLISAESKSKGISSRALGKTEEYDLWVSSLLGKPDPIDLRSKPLLRFLHFLGCYFTLYSIVQIWAKKRDYISEALVKPRADFTSQNANCRW